MTTFILSTPMWCEIDQGRILKLVVQRLPEGTQQGLPRCVTSGLIEITSAANQSLLAGQSLQGSGTHGSVYMVSVGTSEACFRHSGKEGTTCNNE